MLLSSRLPFWFVSRLPVFRLIPDCYANFPGFYAPNSLATNFPVLYCVWCAQLGGGGGSHGWLGVNIGFMRKFNREFDLTCQPDSRFRIPVCLPVPQGTGGSSSADHMWVRSCDRDYDSTGYPTMYMKNGLVHFLCHGLTQLREYNQVFPP